jgi:hypothetical protein
LGGLAACAVATYLVAILATRLIRADRPRRSAALDIAHQAGILTVQLIIAIEVAVDLAAAFLARVEQSATFAGCAAGAAAADLFAATRFIGPGRPGERIADWIADFTFVCRVDLELVPGFVPYSAAAELANAKQTAQAGIAAVAAATDLIFSAGCVVGADCPVEGILFLIAILATVGWVR